VIVPKTEELGGNIKELIKYYMTSQQNCHFWLNLIKLLIKVQQKYIKILRAAAVC